MPRRVDWRTVELETAKERVDGSKGGYPSPSSAVHPGAAGHRGVLGLPFSSRKKLRSVLLKPSTWTISWRATSRSCAIWLGSVVGRVCAGQKLMAPTMGRSFWSR